MSHGSALGGIALAADSTVREGDVVGTGKDGYVQLAMVDGARVALRPVSQMRIGARLLMMRTGPGFGSIDANCTAASGEGEKIHSRA